jgi:hypothetical protein
VKCCKAKKTRCCKSRNGGGLLGGHRGCCDNGNGCDRGCDAGCDSGCAAAYNGGCDAGCDGVVVPADAPAAGNDVPMPPTPKPDASA